MNAFRRNIRLLLRVSVRWGDIEECAGCRDALGAISVGKEPVVADAVLERLENATPRPDRGMVLGAMGDPSRVLKEFKGFWTSAFQPELVSDRALEADPLFAMYKSAQAHETDALVRTSESEWNYWNKRGDQARLDFIRRFERNRYGVTYANPTEARMAQRYRILLDANWALEKRWGSQASFVEDYLAHIWERPEGWRAFSAARSAQMGPTWFQKERTIDYIDEGLTR